MKNLELSSCGVQEMNTQEMKQTSGGILGWLIGGWIVGLVVGLLWSEGVFDRQE